MSGTVLVMGATGEVGGRVLRALVRRGMGVVGASRDPTRAAASLGGSWRELDLERAATFAPALQGVERLFLVARPGDDDPDVPGGQLLAAVVATGVRHVVLLSAFGAEQEPDFGLRRLELLLEASGLSWTHLRPNFFMQVFAGPPLLPALLATGMLRLPAADARLSYVDTRDIADVAVAALTGEDHQGKAYALTGPESLDHYDVVRLISAAAGVDFRYEPIPEAAAAAALAAGGLSAARVQRLLGFYRRVRADHCAPVHGDVATVLGRPARAFEEFAAHCAPCWRQPRVAPASASVRLPT